jgi:hypothetical protein
MILGSEIMCCLSWFGRKPSNLLASGRFYPAVSSFLWRFTVNSLLPEIDEPPNGSRYLRVGGRGFCLEARKARSQKNA